MPTSTYDLIASSVITSSTASVTFSSLPSTYRDLVLIMEAESESISFPYPLIRANSDTAANYAYVEAFGYSSTATSASAGAYGFTAVNGGMNTIAGKNNIIWYFLDYSATDKHKPCLVRQNHSENQVGMAYSRWANTAAITSLNIVPSNGATAGSTFAAGSTFYLYGIVS